MLKTLTHIFHKILLMFFVAFITILNAQAQNLRIKFDNISLEDGLTQSSVYCILQDSKGFMWFGTLDGLNRYDGYAIMRYRNNPQDTTSIPENSINTLFEDSKGVLWIGTRGKGMSRYNQIKDNFVTIKSNPKNKNSLSNNNVRTITEDKNGNFWIGTEGGLDYWDRKNNQWKHYKYDEKNDKSLSSNIINKIVIDERGDLWVATDAGLNHFDIAKQEFRRWKNIALREEDAKYNPYLVPDKINTLYKDKDGVLWIGTNNGLTKRINIRGKYSFYTYKQGADTETNFGKDIVTAIVQDESGIFWIGTEKGGFIRFDSKTENFKRFVNDPADPNSLSVNHILTLFLDKTNVLWIGTNLGGVNKWNRMVEGVEVFRHNPYDSKSLSASQVRTLYQDKKGDFWIGTVDGGLNHWEVATNSFKRYTFNPLYSSTLSHNHVRTILEDSKDNFWIGTEGGGISKMDKKVEKFSHYKHDENDPTSISNDKVWKIYEDSEGVVWVATSGGGLNIFNTTDGTFKAYRHSANNPNSISSDYVTCLLEDSKQRFWVGTYGGGLNLLDRKTMNFKRFVHNDNDTNSLGNDRIYSIVEDSDGDLWIGTKGSLNKYDSKTGKFVRYTEANGLPNDVIMGILEDNQKNLWISTNQGLCKFNKRTDKTRNYDVRDGLQSNEFLVGAYLKAKDGELLFGGINGFNTFYPEAIKDNEYIPKVLITRFQLFNKDFPLDSAITEKKIIYLDYYQNFINFEFVALNYIYPEKNQYKYFLSGKDKDTILTKRRFQSYTDLEPGKYVFTVKGSNNDGRWNNVGASVTIIIKPAFWQTLAFKITLIALAIAIVVFGYKWRIRRIEAQKQHLEELVRLRTAEIMQQKEEIEAQRDAIEEQRDAIEEQRDAIEEQRDEIEKQRDVAARQRDQISEQKKEITDSIHYARRIQKAVMPASEIIKQKVAEHFVLFKPKDIVSGDFFWASNVDDKLIIVAADCTGHGVPGAFMSMLGISFLNRIVSEKGISKPHEILNRLRQNIINSLHQKGAEGEAKDGMDATLCTLDITNSKLYFAGANNPLLFVRNGEIETYKADKMPIAIYDNLSSFTTTEIDVQKGDCFYLFSDGYIDQFGGAKGKRFKTPQFRDLLTQNSHLPMTEIQLLLNNTIEEWKSFTDPDTGKPFEQTDDILVIGVRV